MAPVTPYADEAYADAYFSGSLDEAAWATAGTAPRPSKEVALKHATLLLDNLNWLGYVDEDEISEPGRQWPRKGLTQSCDHWEYVDGSCLNPGQYDGVVLEPVKNACCETALAVVLGRTSQALMADVLSTGDLSAERIGEVSRTWKTSASSSLKSLLDRTAGLGSIAAMQLIKHLLMDPKAVRIRRTS